jgi:DNA-binding GntR family transcriptional regulator
LETAAARNHRKRGSLRHPRSRKVALSRKSLHDQVAEQLRDMIVRGDLRQGEKVPVAELAKELGVSLTPLREALKVLAEDQLIELTPNRGARVLSFTPEEAEKLFEVIAVLEGAAAELAAVHMTTSQLAELEEMHAQMRLHYERHERTLYFDLNSKIHKSIVEFANNEVLTRTHTKLNVRASRGRYIAIIDAGRWSEAMAEHEAVMEAFRNHDPATAMSVWRMHLKRSGEVTCDVLRRRIAGELDAEFQPVTDSGGPQSGV